MGRGQARAECAEDPSDGDIPRMWNGGWQRYLFPSVWLIYLAQTVVGINERQSGAAAVFGYVLVGAFAVSYLAALPMGWQHQYRQFWIVYGLCIGFTIGLTFYAHEDAFACLVYLAVLTVAAHTWWSVWGILALSTIATFGASWVPSWNKPGEDWYSGLSVLLVSFAMVGFFHIIQSNRELAAARAEVARLAAENERSRIARDLHDLLGHSLTTITVKAGLARRLAERGEAERSLTEITEVEQLTRRTLGDVRAAVAGHRDVTLVGELATSREVLRAAAIAAELPGSVDVVEPDLSELFGWVLREGVTNMVRHSHAERCKVTLGPRWIEISDDGKGGTPGAGNGLVGLRERVDLVGGTLSATGGLVGFTLRADVPAGADVPASTVPMSVAPAPATEDEPTVVEA